MSETANFEHFMKPALRASLHARGKTGCNPNVGAALWRDGRLISVTSTAVGGRPHAETQLPEIYEEDILAVTLEPCAHEGVTPSCAKFISRRPPSQVLVAVVDPDPRTSGKGIEILKHAGVHVIVGVAEEGARYHMAGFLSRVERRRPYVRLKIAMSMDGRSALADGTSRWISNEDARRHAHLLRAEAQAIMVGARTSSMDRPQLTCRLGSDESKLEKLILCGRTRPSFIPDNALVIGTHKQNCDLVCAEDKDGRPELHDVLHQLALHGIGDLLVESGGTLAASLLSYNLVDELYIYQSPMVLGGDARPAMGALHLSEIVSLSGVVALRRRSFGDNMLHHYIFESKP